MNGSGHSRRKLGSRRLEAAIAAKGIEYVCRSLDKMFRVLGFSAQELGKLQETSYEFFRRLHYLKPWLRVSFVL